MGWICFLRPYRPSTHDILYKPYLKAALKREKDFDCTMRIMIERTQHSLEKDFSGVAKDLLKELGILVEDVLIIKNKKLVTEDEDLGNEDEITLLSVISGG